MKFLPTHFCSVRASRPLALNALLALAILCASSPVCTDAAEGLPGYVVLGLPSLSHSNLATIRVNVNGHATLLMLDTGATHLFLDRSFFGRERPFEIRSGEHERSAARVAEGG